MLQTVSILFGAGFTVAVMLALGKLLLRRLGLRFYRQEENVFALVTGAASLSLLVFALAMLRLAHPVVLLVVGLGAIALALRCGVHRPAGDPLPPLSRGWKILFWTVFAAFAFLYFFNAMAPEVSPDGSTYHLGLVRRYLEARGMYRITTNLYSNLSQGTELLYLFAFAFGRQSAASLVHFVFLVTLPLAMLSYGRRFGLPAAGAMGALLTFASPIAGYDGTTAYIDIAVACVLFTVFYLLQIWDQERTPALLVVIGLLAGFAYAMKYTALLALPYALGLVAWKTWRRRGGVLRPAAIVAGCALVMILPWVVRNWIWFDNPFSPFLNSWFPNPYMHIGFEQSYRAQLSHWGGVAGVWHTPLEVTVRGQNLQGLVGPVFLLAPVALLALRYAAGRQLLLAAVLFLAPYPLNIGTRFLLPCLPFLSLAMGLAAVNWKAMAPLLVLAHAVSAWPAFLETYRDRYALCLHEIPIRAALRIETEDQYLQRKMPEEYAAIRMIEESTSPGANVLAFSPRGDAYTSRNVLVSYLGALNNNLADMLLQPRKRDWQATRQLTFRFPKRALRRIRIVQTAAGFPEYWSINELRVYADQVELPRRGRRLRADPNPWELRMAIDNNPVTRWRSWQPLFEGEYVEVDFGRLQAVDSVVLDTTPDQWHTRLHLEGQMEDEPWATVAADPEASSIPPAPYLRRLISWELRRRGISYLLIADNDYIAADLREKMPEWGVTLAEARGVLRLYRID